MIKPLFKYTGGKFKEYTHINRFFPEKVKNYYEPFVGGGGVMFQLHNNKKIDGRIFINDFSKSLIDFYKCLSDKDFGKELYNISNAWDRIDVFSESVSDKYGQYFDEIVRNRLDKEFVTEELYDEISHFCENLGYNMHHFDLRAEIVNGLLDKIKRFKKKNLDDDGEKMAFQCITTSIHQSFYFIVRRMYNDWNNNGNEAEYTIKERSAQWFFIREFCFGSMFRYDSKGNFNVPYGGFGYNKKCFTCKIENILNDEVNRLFAENVTLSCSDFEEEIKRHNYCEDDLIFLDPPYDSTFSEYDDNSFTHDDHIRLEKTLRDVKCKWIMAIGKTDFISNLYKDYNVLEYDKTYAYQARGTYDNKKTTHLLISNYELKL